MSYSIVTGVPFVVKRTIGSLPGASSIEKIGRKTTWLRSLIAPATFAAGRSPVGASSRTNVVGGSSDSAGRGAATASGEGTVVVVTGTVVVVVGGAVVVTTGTVVVVTGGAVVVVTGTVVVVVGGVVVVVVVGAGAADFMKTTVTNMTPSPARPTPTPMRS